MFFDDKVGVIKKESESLVFIGLEIPRDYNKEKEEIMFLKEINEKIKEIRKRNRAYLSNIIYSKLNNEEDYAVVCKDDAIAILVEERNRVSAFFAASDAENLEKLLLELPGDTYIEHFHNDIDDELREVFEAGEYKYYAEYVRCTVTWIKNPYEFPEKGRRAILQEMYNPAQGEFPQEKDAEEIYQLCLEKFDPVIDDVFSIEEWRKTIANKECLVVKENGKIITIYKWRIEGKKLYNNLVINLGTANLLYNLERSIFEKYWEEGIRTAYAWINILNKKALKRGPKYENDIIKSKKLLYDTIYKKHR